MIIKKFVGKTEEEAVEAAKKELGSTIVIMNVKQVKAKGILGLFRSKQMEVTVALEEEREITPRARQNKPPISQINETVQVGENSSPERTTASPQEGIRLQSINSRNIEQKLDSLQTLLESQIKNKEVAGRVDEKNAAEVEKNRNITVQSTEENKEAADETEPSENEKFIRLLYNTMVENEVEEKYARQMLEDIDKTIKPNTPLDYILANIYQKMVLKFGKAEKIQPSDKGAKVVLFIGPTGVGKTTTIAKIAGRYVVEEKKKVVLLTADTYRIAAVEQLRTYANIMEVPFRVIYTTEELQLALNDFKESDYIFIDTAGHSHRNAKQLEDMKGFTNILKETCAYQAFLVLSATTKYSDLVKISENYKAVSDYQLIFTKLDETMKTGNLLNIKLHTDTPIAYITYGQNVPDDIEVFNPQSTVKQLLGGKS